MAIESDKKNQEIFNDIKFAIFKGYLVEISSAFLFLKNLENNLFIKLSNLGFTSKKLQNNINDMEQTLNIIFFWLFKINSKNPVLNPAIKEIIW